MLLEGTLLRGPSFDPVEGRVVVEDGMISAVEDDPARSSDIILPAFASHWQGSNLAQCQIRPWNSLWSPISRQWRSTTRLL